MSGYIGKSQSGILANPSNNTVETSDIQDDAVSTAKIADDAVTPAKLSTGAPEWTSGGNVGIGTSSPSNKLHIKDASPNIIIEGTSYPAIKFTGTDLVTDAEIYYGVGGNDLNILNRNNGVMTFHTNNTECMRIEADGDIWSNYGGGGSTVWRRDMIFRSETSGTYGSGIHFTDNATMPVDSTGSFNNGIENLGIGSYKWNTLFAANGSINTSDINKKQQISELSDSEMAVAKRISALFRTYKWNDAVEEKGDNARIHTGVMAQHLQQAFTDEGLDATKYAMFCSDTVYEVINEDGNVTDFYTQAADIPEGVDTTTRIELALRYSEVFAFICAYNDQRFTELEARIAALESV